MKTTPWILSIILLTVIFIRECSRPEPCIDGGTVVIIDTIPGDSVPYNTFIDKPYPVYVDTGTFQWRYYPVDTMAVLKKYFAKNTYKRVLKDDSSALIVLTDTVTQNQLMGSLLSFQNRRKQIVQNIIQPPAYDYRIYAGAGLGANDYEGSIKVGAMITTRGKAYEIDYDIFSRMVTAKVYFPLFKVKAKSNKN